MCSINPDNDTDKMTDKIRRLKGLITRHQPHIIAIVESWLTKNHHDEEILNLLGLNWYRIFRQDRCSGHHPGNAYGHSRSVQSKRRGGGVLVLWNPNDVVNASLERNPAEDHEDNVVNFDLFYTFNCTKCSGRKSTQKFGFTVVYRRPSRFKGQDRAEYEEINQTVIDRLVHLPFMYNDSHPDLDYRRWVMVGDFNWNPENRQHHWLLTYLCSAGNVERSNLSSQCTHRAGHVLDHVIGSPGFVVNSTDASSSVVDVTEIVSDHAALIFSLKLGKDCSTYRPCNARRCR
ncbi:unnamed protein product [Adineta steineri]|nr:unnamed protein product [Adineta steineri]